MSILPDYPKNPFSSSSPPFSSSCSSPSAPRTYLDLSRLNDQQQFPCMVEYLHVYKRIFKHGAVGVYKAFNTVERTNEIVKTATFDPDPDSIPQLKNEREKHELFKTRSPHIVHLKHILYGPNGPDDYSLVFNNEGKSLEDLFFKNSVVISSQKIKKIIWQVLCGAEHLHKHQLIHLDIKPANIVMNKKGRVKLIDLGSTSSIEEECHQLEMTHGYRPPEDILGDEKDYTTDMFSIMLIAGELYLQNIPNSHLVVHFRKFGMKPSRYCKHAVFQEMVYQIDREPSLEEKKLASKQKQTYYRATAQPNDYCFAVTLLDFQHMERWERRMDLAGFLRKDSILETDSWKRFIKGNFTYRNLRWSAEKTMEAGRKFLLTHWGNNEVSPSSSSSSIPAKRFALAAIQANSKRKGDFDEESESKKQALRNRPLHPVLELF